MNAGISSTENNPNSTWLNSKGTWLTYILLLSLIHLACLSIPFINTSTAWTLTNTLHNLISFYLVHMITGTPWESVDQGEARKYTYWEQIDYGVYFTATRKFLICVPIALFLIASFYTKYDYVHFMINMSTMLLVVIAKLPQLHGVRFFQINKY
ncbi:hypothetical protein GJ496_004242 [Pomphorhynchus laevis]|nr:hypothetical protein GJ496_004242 [Pomphorhynchus laevis]